MIKIYVLINLKITTPSYSNISSLRPELYKLPNLLENMRADDKNSEQVCRDYNCTDDPVRVGIIR